VFSAAVLLEPCNLPEAKTKVVKNRPGVSGLGAYSGWKIRVARGFMTFMNLSYSALRAVSSRLSFSIEFGLRFGEFKDVELIASEAILLAMGSGSKQSGGAMAAWALRKTMS
jgi:hypothetical protein